MAKASQPAPGPAGGLTVPQKLRICREFRGLEQTALAEQARCTQSTVSDYENGKRQIPADRLAQLLTALDISPQTLHADHPSEAAFLAALGPAAPVGPTPLPLPPKPPHLFGRDDLVRRLTELFDTAAGELPNLPLVGIGGIGKSTVALWFLHEPGVQRRYAGRVHFVPLDTADSRDKLVFELARYLGLPTSEGDLEGRLLDHLGRGGRRLIVLDNAETPLIAAPLPVKEFLNQLAALAHVGLVATLRPETGVVGPRWAVGQPVAALDLTFARDLFLTHAGQRFAADSDLNDFLSPLAGWPIVVKIAGERCSNYRTVRQFRADWDRKRKKMYRAGGDDRRLNFAVCVGLSLDHPKMAGPGRRLLTLLGHLPDGIGVEDVEELLPDDGAEAEAAVREVGGLVFESGGRLDVLPPLRDYLRGELPPVEDDRERLINYYCGQADRANDYKQLHSEGILPWLTVNLANCESAVRLAWDSRQSLHGVNAIRGLARYGRSNGLDYRPQLREAIRSTTHVSVQAWCYCDVGNVSLTRNELKAAESDFDSALETLGTTQDDSLRGNCVLGLGNVALWGNKLEVADARYAEAQPLFKTAGDELGQANCVLCLGHVALRLDDRDRAAARYAEARSLFQAAGSRLGEANCVSRLGDVALRRGDLEGAAARYAEAQPLFIAVRNRLGQANCDFGKGECERLAKRLPPARSHFHSALAGFEAVPDSDSVGAVHWSLARVALTAGERAAHVAAARDAWRLNPKAWANFPELFPTEPREDDLPPLAPPG